MTSGSRRSRSGGSEMPPDEPPCWSIVGPCVSTIGDPASVLDIERVASFKIVDMIG